MPERNALIDTLIFCATKATGDNSERRHVEPYVRPSARGSEVRWFGCRQSSLFVRVDPIGKIEAGPHLLAADSDVLNSGIDAHERVFIGTLGKPRGNLWYSNTLIRGVSAHRENPEATRERYMRGMLGASSL